MVIDTNLLLSAAFRDRLPERVLLWCVAPQSIVWLVTPEILAEYVDVLRRPKFALPQAVIAHWEDLVRHRTTVIEPNVDIELVRDRKDAKFLNCAAAGAADYLITGDRDFDDARDLVTARILSARDFALACAPELLQH
jgi:putative PIN family toxin of toxin-antitoxin system